MTRSRSARGGVRFWILVALFVLLIVGTVDIAARLWARDLTLCVAPCDAGAFDGLALLAWYLSMNGLIVMAGVLGYWLARCLLGWWRARRGDDATLASHGGAGWLLVIGLLLAVNLAAIALLVADALNAADAAGRAQSWLDVLTLVSNVWVLVYYARRRRWDGSPVPRTLTPGPA